MQGLNGVQARKVVCGIAALVVVLLCAERADGLTYHFVGEPASGGETQATMSVETDGNVLRAVIRNDSPIVLDDGFLNSGGDDSHSPAITGFGV